MIGVGVPVAAAVNVAVAPLVTAWLLGDVVKLGATVGVPAVTESAALVDVVDAFAPSLIVTV